MVACFAHLWGECFNVFVINTSPLNTERPRSVKNMVCVRCVEFPVVLSADFLIILAWHVYEYMDWQWVG